MQALCHTVSCVALFLIAALLSDDLKVAEACSSAFRKAGNGNLVWGRTQDWDAFDFDAVAAFVPKGSQVPQVPACDDAGNTDAHCRFMSVTSKYDITGIMIKPSLSEGICDALRKEGIVKGTPACFFSLTDGLNSAGLGISEQWDETVNQDTYAKYKPVDGTSAEPRKAVAMSDLPMYLLSNFATVAEVKEALAQLTITRHYLPETKLDKRFSLFLDGLKLHQLVVDASGAAIIIEIDPKTGTAMAKDNTIGVMTNEPQFEQQVELLNKHFAKNLPPGWKPGMPFPSTFEYPAAVPGDESSESRFQRLAMYLFSNTSWHKLGGSDIGRASVPNGSPLDSYSAWQGADSPTSPKPAVLEMLNFITKEELSTGFTQWTGIKDLTNKNFYYRTPANPTLQVLSLEALASKYPDTPQTLKLSKDAGALWAVEVTDMTAMDSKAGGNVKKAGHRGNRRFMA